MPTVDELAAAAFHLTAGYLVPLAVSLFGAWVLFTGRFRSLVNDRSLSGAAARVVGVGLLAALPAGLALDFLPKLSAPDSAPEGDARQVRRLAQERAAKFREQADAIRAQLDEVNRTLAAALAADAEDGTPPDTSRLELKRDDLTRELNRVQEEMNPLERRLDEWSRDDRGLAADFRGQDRLLVALILLLLAHVVCFAAPPRFRGW
jgi:hypothetical protein